MWVHRPEEVVMLRLPARRDTVHLVDDLGLVGCPRRGHDVTVEACLDCNALQDVVRTDGRITEIRCEPPPHRGEAVFTPFFGPLGPDRRWWGAGR
jgi:hypothetical protein